MLAPSIFNNNFMNDFFKDSFDDMFHGMFHTPFEHAAAGSMMCTDIQDMGDHYQMEMELPGYQKEDLKADLKDGYLTISAQRSESKDEKDKDGRFVRRERYMGHCQRSFYVGSNVTQDDIRASFENGVLKLDLPKKEAQPAEERKYIAIE